MKSQLMHRILTKIVKRFGYKIIDPDNPVDLLNELEPHRYLGNGKTFSRDFSFFRYLLLNFKSSHAQLFQDLFVLHELAEKRGGYFVEFGGTDGVSLSNTFLLEQAHGWQGIVSEPARVWHSKLRKNRKCTIDTRCVWSATGETLAFNETGEGALSTVNSFSSADQHSESRKHGKIYEVETISLNDLLFTHKAPFDLDYLSIDTEGSEFTILNEFDLSKWNVKIISVEHNYTPSRQKISTLLEGSGYVNILKDFSRWDDWYVKAF